MALVTLQRSPTPSAASSSASTSEEVGSDEDRKLNLSLSESFFMVKGAALFLQQGNSAQGPRSLQQPHKHAGDLPQHLQVMINLLRCEDRIKLAVRLESVWTDRVRYMVVVYSSGRQDTEENVLLGVDFSSKESTSCTIGMVLRLWSDTKIHLDGDGGFSVSTAGRMHVFKPVSVQAMWSALQILHKACEVARRYNYFPGGMALVWATYYESCIGSDQSCINEWNAMQDLESTRPDSPALFVDKPTEGERTERLIKAKLRSIMMSQDLENVTSKEIRNELEKQMNCNLKEFKEFIDNEMLLILGQMDKPSLIFDHLYLGSEWNASNLEELQGSGVDYILNVTREIDNFFPGLFAYHNIRVYDEETTDLLAHWNEAYHFINKAKKNHSKCLVHCKMGVSRSASTVIAYAMKEFGWPLEKAFNYVKQKRSIARPNAGFMRQLSEYEGILDASKQRHNKLWKQQTESSLPQGADDSPGPGAFLMESLDADLEARLVTLDSPKQPGLLDSQAPGGPAFPYCYHQLPDPLPNSSGNGSDLIQLEDLERGALLGEAVLEPARHPRKGSGLCDKEGRKKLESGVPGAPSGPLAQVEEMERDENPGAERRAQPLSQPPGNRLHLRENINNNNSKRSCPEDFGHDAIFGILNKVKPSYQSCADCMYSTPRAAPETFGEQCEKLSSPAICTQPSLLPHLTPSPVDLASSKSRLLERPSPSPGESSPALLPASFGRLDAGSSGKPAEEPPGGLSDPPKESQKVLAKSLGLLKNSHCEKSLPSLEVVKEDPASKKEAKATKDLRLLLFSKELAKPTASSYLMQHQESIIQLQKAGLVRKHTKELERMKGIPAEAASPLRDSLTSSRLEASIPEECQELLPPQGGACPLACPPSPGEAGGDSEKLEAALPLEGASQKSSGPSFLYRLDHTSSFSKDFLKTICYTPTSSSMSSNLTRSSSSDSIHSVRGKPGLVKQRTQEIETRLRLAGLTVSSPLKRSHSLAKLGSLNFSSEDLSSEADMSTVVDSQDTQLSESSFSQEPHSAPRNPPMTLKLSGKPSPGSLTSAPWMGRS
ncbi:protein phosphatase Slingshot homolog 1 isoform X1 [Phascolarctos cinereus]|uniref:Protein phosphatase Slingshot homolog 1 n=2 Tax=Phascolarctos cinereus TaxID=38626 RepID=A0A6P5M5Z6_PHACI|nr:protein phosphatase Slingshot homolog 1 isoform X1 [Phascolarctos cinereus]